LALSSDTKKFYFRVIRRDVISFIKAQTGDLLQQKCGEDEENAIPEYLRRQAYAIAAVMVYWKYANYPEEIKHTYPVSGPSFSRMKRKIEEDKNTLFSYSTLLTLEGRPSIYPLVIDDFFLSWVEDEDTATIEKTVPNMIDAYKDMYSVFFGDDAGEELSDEGLRRHISAILARKGYHMRKPNIVDARRCVKYETLQQWFSDPDVKKSLENIDPLLLFNADETEVNRKVTSQGWLIAKVKNSLVLPQETVLVAMYLCFS